ncbi:uncharacterized protein PHACADRAFT_196346 [Phanerochaete carnosa HHB-10118-sp]|uniref:F-box domain-containing protein n=1 Tax=Phanerochaete carnosa (strain HHB-10118-sp) TaxID=650164 RepID=K5W4N9_PHACS|nr:uncharacterized protein PHACADRAFT_196346 [Phanerochaete carnosa HHB-10118-sp]EKM53904.1 hypothetical protein PHACADRAFT_196346 [Phanerochaete carnosa HHB-10118-sp]
MARRDQHVGGTVVPALVERLPQELVDKIIDELSTDRRALRSCSLTSRRWLSRSSRHLFASFTLAGVNDIAPVLQSAQRTQSTQRILSNIVDLTLFIPSFDYLKLIENLPLLRELTIWEIDDPAEEESLSMPRLKAAGRTIVILEVHRISIFLVDSLLWLFESVGTLRLRDLYHFGAVPPCPAQHVVKNLDMRYIHPRLLRHVSMVLDHSALEGLTTQPLSPYEDGLQPVLNDFTQAVGRNLRAFHLMYYSAMCADFGPARLPILSSCAHMTSVTLTTDAFTHHSHPIRPSRALAFLTSLPAAVCHVRLELKYYEPWIRGATLVQKIQEVDWAAIGRALGAYANLASLEIGVKRTYHMPNHESFADDLSAQAAVLERLPARLGAVVVFI